MFKSILPALGFLALAGVAEADVTLDQQAVVIGSSMQIIQGYKGETSHTVRIPVSDGAYAVQPMSGAGWTLVADADDEGDHAMGGTMAGTTSYTVGDLTISHPFSRATLPNAPVAGGFFTVTNNGAEDDRLIGASSDVAGHLEVHEMAMEGDIMRMRELKDGLPIPAGETVELKPGGYHVMFMDLKQPLVQGEIVMVTLVFEKAGEIEIPLAIGAPNAKGHGAMHHDGMKMKHGAPA